MVVLEERVADGQQAETSQWRRAIKGTSGLFDNRAGSTHTRTHTFYLILWLKKYLKSLPTQCVCASVFFKFNLNYLLSDCFHSGLIIFIEKLFLFFLFFFKCLSSPQGAR